MKINKYNFNGVELNNMESEVRTILFNPIQNKIFAEIDIKPENGSAIQRENIKFAISEEAAKELYDKLIALIAEHYDFETGKKINIPESNDEPETN